MNIERLQELINSALWEPNKALVEFCEPYYSPYYQLLYLLAHESDSPIAVELGVETGRGSKSLLMGGAIVYGVEEDKRKLVERLDGASNYTLIRASSTPAPEVIPEGISILLVDTEHSYAQAREEFAAYKSRLKSGAVVLFDDTNAMDGDVLKFVQTLPYDMIVDDRLHPNCGFAAVIYDPAKETE